MGKNQEPIHHLLALTMACRGQLKPKFIQDDDDEGRIIFKKYNQFAECVVWLESNGYIASEGKDMFVSDKGIIAMELVLAYFKRVNDNILNEKNLSLSMEAFRGMEDGMMSSFENSHKADSNDKQMVEEET